MLVVFDLVARSADQINSGLAILSELVVEGQVRLSVRLKLEEASWIVVNVGVAEVVELVGEGVLDVLLELGGVLGEVLVELARGILELIRCSSSFALADDLVDTALNISASQVFLL